MYTRVSYEFKIGHVYRFSNDKEQYRSSRLEMMDRYERASTLSYTYFARSLFQELQYQKLRLKMFSLMTKIKNALKKEINVHLFVVK